MKIKVLSAALLLFSAMVAQAQGGQRGGSDPAQRAEIQTKMMADSLSLSTKQGEKVKEINLKYANKQKEARQANSDGNWEKMQATMGTLRTEQDAELKTVLTQEQYDRWQKIASQQTQRRGNQGRDTDGKEGQGRKGKKGTPPPPPPPAPEQGGGN
ncbi:MAG: DUF4890 domain-containing protein [Saprospiraceae bacterium]|nr:DUF4890 domain-containing protein [Saprospiraceae bacterium]MCF8252456.1 DUF4890 domain-containing protein [Saprospiraceae bacterium]MCF8282323.1 DUF4890 domain-containing protein [Bacteroidales bacterium]MCF8314057.1 DUF4890 domain-containing protein [Saprospiraceae bacterium]MCF8442795.1 DUF4890 domain-containing protein [Saprospiraceae bacterium]